MEYSSVSKIMDEIACLTPIYGGISYERLSDTSLQWPCPDCSHPGTRILHSKNFSRGKGVLYHFHTRTMSGKADGLNEIAPMAVSHINEEDAASLKIKDSDMVVLRTRRGSIKTKAMVDSKIKKGIVFVPFHYADAPANRLTNPALDPKAKIPEFKACAVNISKA